MRVLLKLSLAWFCALQLWAAPSVSAIHPRAVVPGRKTVLTFTGSGLETASNLWTSFGGTARRLADSSDKVMFEVICPDAANGIHAVQLSSPDGATEFELLLVDSLPARDAAPERQSRSQPMPIVPPIAVDANASSEKIDYYTLSAKAGETFSIEAIAHRIGSEMDPVVKIYNGSGREIAFCDDEPGIWRDARFSFTAPSAGNYLIAVHDAAFGGGTSYFYHLRISQNPIAFFNYPLIDPAERRGTDEPVETSLSQHRRSPADPPVGHGIGAFPAMSEIEPNDTATNAQPLFIPTFLHGRIQRPADLDFFSFKAEKGQKLVFDSQTRWLGSPCDLVLSIMTTDGKTVAKSDSIRATDAAVTNEFLEAGTYLLEVRELSGNSLANVPYRIKVAPFTPGVFATVATNHLGCTPGKGASLKINVFRFGYKGPLSVEVEGSGGSVAIENGVIPEYKNEGTITLTVSPKTPIGAVFHLKLKILGADCSFVSYGPRPKERVSFNVEAPRSLGRDLKPDNDKKRIAKTLLAR